MAFRLTRMISCAGYAKPDSRFQSLNAGLQHFDRVAVVVKAIYRFRKSDARTESARQHNWAKNGGHIWLPHSDDTERNVIAESKLEHPQHVPREMKNQVVGEL